MKGESWSSDIWATPGELQSSLAHIVFYQSIVISSVCWWALFDFMFTPTACKLVFYSNGTRTDWTREVLIALLLNEKAVGGDVVAYCFSHGLTAVRHTNRTANSPLHIGRSAGCGQAGAIKPPPVEPLCSSPSHRSALGKVYPTHRHPPFFPPPTLSS